MPLALGRRCAYIASMAEKHPKRPRDLNQWAKRMVDIAIGEVEDDLHKEEMPGGLDKK